MIQAPSHYSWSNLVLMSATALGLASGATGLCYLAAPMMAVLAERDVATESNLATHLIMGDRQPVTESTSLPV